MTRKKRLPQQLRIRRCGSVAAFHRHVTACAPTDGTLYQ
jgi:ribosomal protein L37E